MNPREAHVRLVASVAAHDPRRSPGKFGVGTRGGHGAGPVPAATTDDRGAITGPSECQEEVVVPVTPSEVTVRHRQVLADTASWMLTEHGRDRDGMCGGYMRLIGQWVWHTHCVHLAWARSVIETPGAIDEQP